MTDGVDDLRKERPERGGGGTDGGLGFDSLYSSSLAWRCSKDRIQPGMRSGKVERRGI